MKKLIIFGIDDMAEVAKFFFDNDSEYRVEAFTVDREYRKNQKNTGKEIHSANYRFMILKI